MEVFVFLFLLAVWVGLAWAGGAIAQSKGRPVILGVLLGALLGLIGLLIVAIIPADHQALAERRSGRQLPPGQTYRQTALASAPSTTCPGCGAANAASARFCGACGRPLVNTCPSCGAEPPSAEARYCSHCGAALHERLSAICARCGEVAGVGDRACNRCGQSLVVS